MSDYILADDLSGALEAGASFRSCGHPMSLSLKPAGSQEANVVSSETRSVSPDAAEEIIVGIIRQKSAEGGRLLFKKIDSSLRGPLGAELRALAKAINPPLMILCPANPATGRTVSEATLYIDGVPLTETAFRHDPLWPAKTSHLPQLLADAGIPFGYLPLAILRSDRAAETLKAENLKGTKLFVCDAETNDDLNRLIATACRVEPKAVFIGANGLAMALAARSRSETVSPPTMPPRPGSLLIVCGSRHPASHRQVEHLSRNDAAALVTVSLAHASPAAVAKELQNAFATKPIAALRFAPEEKVSSADLLAFITDTLVPFSSSTVPAGYFFTGGETAWTGARALGGCRLQIVSPWENAVVGSILMRKKGLPLALFTKPGGYGDPAMLARFVGEVMAG